MTAVQLIVGLGNPGPEYDQTRHNAGALFVERLAHAQGVSLVADRKYFGLVGKFSHQGKGRSSVDPDHLHEPQRPVRSGAGGILPDRPGRHPGGPRRTRHAPGVAKLKTGGGHGGHNGLRDIIAQLGNQNSFHRLRLGIGHPGHSSLVSGYVLGRARAASRNCSTPASTSPSACCRKCSPGTGPGRCRSCTARRPEPLF